MRRVKNTLLLYIIIVIEGYIVLSTELLAMRKTTTYVGSGTDTVSIIIASVLLPLALGYYVGGNFKQRRFFGKYITIRKKLIINLLIASALLLPGMTHYTIGKFFQGLDYLEITNRITSTSLYCMIFIAVPVYLLGQTIPLISNYFSKEKLSLITGRMLFFSTLGSFMGAIFSTLLLMSTIGVNNTITLNFVLFASLVILISKYKHSQAVIFSMIIAGLALFGNSNAMLARFGIVENNLYNDHIVFTDPRNGDRHLIMNGNDSSKYNDFGDKHAYVEFAERIAIDNILYANPPKNILVIGAGAFTFGNQDKNNYYTFVDIDKDLKDIAEKYILKEKITGHKEFFAMDIRAYLRTTNKKFDVVFLDAYLGGISIPETLVTQEFFQQIKDALNDKGLLVTNFIVSPNFTNTFSRSLDNTLRSVFPHVSRHVIYEDYDLWEASKSNAANVAYIYRHENDYDSGSIYTDDKNKVFIEKPKKLGK